MPQDRTRGESVFGKVTFQTMTVTTPPTTTGGTAYTTVINMNHPVTEQTMFFWHLESTAGVLATGITGASGVSGVTVIPDSTVDYNCGRVITGSTGLASMVFSSTGTSTAVLKLVLMNGVVVTGSTTIFT